MAAKTALYRHWNADGILLYVGISLKPFERLAAHAYGSHWADDIASVTMEYFDSREDADAAERRAIREERPAHNIVHAVRGDKVVEVDFRRSVRKAPQIPDWVARAHVYKHATSRGTSGTDPETAILEACAEAIEIRGRSIQYRMTPERAELVMDSMVADGTLVRRLGATYPPRHGEYIHKFAMPRYLETLADLDSDENEAA